MKKKIILALLITLAAAGLWIGFDKTRDYLADRKEEETYTAQIETISATSGFADKATYHEKLDALRAYINGNTEHNIDDEFYAVWKDKAKITQTFLDYTQGRRKDLPHYECSTRANLMRDILNHHGYKTRSLLVYRAVPQPDASYKMDGHKVLDVQNPDTGKWETQDADYNIYWANILDGTRVSMVDAMADPAHYTPCSGANCGWHIVSRENIQARVLQDYLDVITAINEAEDTRITYHAQDIDPNASFSYQDKSGTLCETLGRHCDEGLIKAQTSAD